MDDTLNTAATTAAQGTTVFILSAVAGIDAALLNIIFGGIVGAFAARVFAPVSATPMTFIKSFTIFACSVFIAVALSGFALDYVVSQGWVTHTANAQRAAGFLVGACAQAIVELVQSIPRIAQANLVEVAKALFSRLSGGGAK